MAQWEDQTISNWDVTKPADTDLVRNFPSAHRIDKTSLRDQLQVEHDVLPPTGTPTGRHKFPSGNTAGRPADPATGSIYFNTQTAQVEQWTGAAWVGRTDFPSGTVMLFKQAAAPVGWTRVVDAGNTDATIILRQNSEVPGTGGSWLTEVDGHALTIAQLPSHTHSLLGDYLAVASTGGNIVPQHVSQSGVEDQSGAAGSGATHTHQLGGGTWRPKHVDVIVCSKA